MTPARPPGWYDEPSGDPAALRWWDGRAWTSVTRDRSASERPPTPVAADVLDSGPPPRHPGDRRTAAYVAVAVTALIALVVAVLPGGDDPDESAAPGPATIAPSEPAPTTAAPVSGRIVDRVARLSYDVLPGDWREWDRESFGGLRSTLGYYRVTQERAPNNQTYWANVNSGPVEEDTTGPTLSGTAQRLITSLSERYYPDHSRSEVVQRDLTVDGAPAALVSYRAVFDPAGAAGYSAQTEQIAVLVVDVGGAIPSALYISLPDTVRDLWPSVEGLLAGVRIVR